MIIFSITAIYPMTPAEEIELAEVKAQLCASIIEQTGHLRAMIERAGPPPHDQEQLHVLKSAWGVSMMSLDRLVGVPDHDLATIEALETLALAVEELEGLIS
jgi:hypothetical protein